MRPLFKALLWLGLGGLMVTFLVFKGQQSDNPTIWGPLMALGVYVAMGLSVVVVLFLLWLITWKWPNVHATLEESILVVAAWATVPLVVIGVLFMGA
jgi:hypothetical protein